MYLSEGWNEFKKFVGQGDSDSSRTRGIIKDAVFTAEVEEAYFLAAAVAQIDNEIDSKTSEPGALLALCGEYHCADCPLRKIKKPVTCGVLGSNKESLMRAMNRYKKLYGKIPIKYRAKS